MNTDHAHTLRDYCRLQNLNDVASAEMIGIDCDGFDVNADKKTLRFNFDEPVTSATTIREALIALAQKARTE
jgi:heme iron utilization protein